MGGNYKDIGASPYPFKFDHDDSTAGELMVPVIIDGAPETLTASAPAASVDVYMTKLDATSNGVAATLADGNFHGQLKKVQAIVVSGGTTTLTISSPVSASLNLITFGTLGDFAVLIWSEVGGYWRILEVGNDADGTSSPTVA